MGQDAAVIVDVRSVLASLSPEDVAKHRKRMKGALYARAHGGSGKLDPSREPVSRLVGVLARHEPLDVKQKVYWLGKMVDARAGGSPTRPKWSGGSRAGLHGRLK